ncbi:MAG: hypothetical protein AseanaTS_29430 [Candidatus Pelagadaptatus aseana]
MCAAVVFLSWYVNYQRVHATSNNFALIRGQSLFHLVQTVRAWNAGHGGVYVPETDTTPSNPYLNVPDRDVSDSLGRQLTKVNPAYMTRQISDLLKGSGVESSLISLKPINPVNRPDDWERKALEQFEVGQLDELLEVVEGHYRYIAPLYIKDSCLQCHGALGYQLGDVRGGLSFKFPVSHSTQLIEKQIHGATQFHLLVFLVLLGLAIALFLSVWLLKNQLQVSQERRQLLEQEVKVDGLTGMLNHNAIVSTLDNELKRAQRAQHKLSVMMIDLDFFKRVNDTYGHQAGDEVLRSVADCISVHLREIDALGRYGGEEFMAVLPDAKLKNAVKVAERIRREIEECDFAIASTGDRESLSVTASFGVAELQLAGCETAEAIIAIADRALYFAKENGRNRVATQADVM